LGNIAAGPNVDAPTLIQFPGPEGTGLDAPAPQTAAADSRRLRGTGLPTEPRTTRSAIGGRHRAASSWADCVMWVIVWVIV